MDPAIVDAITRAANEADEDPAFALSVAERESGGHYQWNDPNAHSSKTIFGLFQMSGDLRQRYGVGNSSDPFTQAQGWIRFIGDQRTQMTKALGRDPTNDELYFAHHFGTDRALHMIQGMPPDTDVRHVFSPYEMSINPHFGRAGTTGNLMASISADMQKRYGKWGGQGQEPYQIAQNSPSAPALTSTSTPAQAIDPSTLGRAAISSVTEPAYGGGAPEQLGSTSGAPLEQVAEGALGIPAAAISPAVSPQPVYGMSAPEAAAYANNPGYRAMRMAQMRGGGYRAGSEVDLSQFGVKPGANLKNPALSNAAPANPALAGTETQPAAVT